MKPAALVTRICLCWSPSRRHFNGSLLYLFCVDKMLICTRTNNTMIPQNIYSFHCLTRSKYTRIFDISTKSIHLLYSNRLAYVSILYHISNKSVKFHQFYNLTQALKNRTLSFVDYYIKYWLLHEKKSKQCHMSNQCWWSIMVLIIHIIYFIVSLGTVMAVIVR